MAEESVNKRTLIDATGTGV